MIEISQTKDRILKALSFYAVALSNPINMLLFAFVAISAFDFFWHTLIFYFLLCMPLYLLQCILLFLFSNLFKKTRFPFVIHTLIGEHYLFLAVCNFIVMVPTYFLWGSQTIYVFIVFLSLLALVQLTLHGLSIRTFMVPDKKLVQRAAFAYVALVCTTFFIVFSVV